MRRLLFTICILAAICHMPYAIWHIHAQEADLEFSLDVNSSTVALPKIFKPNIDLSGRGSHREASWPQGLATKEVLGLWQKDIGFSGIYRLQYNLWEISGLAKDKELQDKLLSNYEEIIKKITEAGGIVILDIFSTPAGLGRVLDKKSVPVDMAAFKELLKSQIKTLSCQKRYNIWYELWSAPDLDDFFLGRVQDYLNLYRAAAEAIKELGVETKIYIPLGGPAVSWWFQNPDTNTATTPEGSLIYELIKFCSRYKLPLDFITWHAYSTDPKSEKEVTLYNKSAISLIRDWLSYFNFDRNTPLIVDEWNYDRQVNVLPERGEKSYICASYIPSRLKNMYEAGLDYQVYFALEDFQNNKEGVNRNVGIFWFDPERSDYKGGFKSIYNVFRILANLKPNMYTSPKLNDEFVGALATKDNDALTVLIYNYIDPDIAASFISRNFASLSAGERKVILRLMKSDGWDKIMRGQLEITKVRTSNRLKNLLKKAKELHTQAEKFKEASRNIKISINNLKDNYLYQRYTVSSSCSIDCDFIPAEEKEISALDSYQETVTLEPYSVHMITLDKKPKEPESAPAVTTEQPVVQNADSQS